MNSICAITGLLILLATTGRAEDAVFRTNRVFKPVEINITEPTVFNVIDAANRLTEVIGPFPVIINSESAVEYEGVSWGQDSFERAWSNVVSRNGGYPLVIGNYTNIFDDPGWIKGTKAAYDTYGAYMWILQNNLNFTTSTGTTCTAGSTNILYIDKVYVGTIGDYAPATAVNLVWPQINATNPLPCPSLTTDLPYSPEQVKFSQDFKAYYKVGVIKVEIKTPNGDPTTTVGANAGNERTYSLGANPSNTVPCEAEFTPLAENLRWTIEDIGEIKAKWTPHFPGDDYTGTGLVATAVYTDLPTNNTAFGAKKITLSMIGVTCTDTQVVETFYPRNETNHPGGQAGSPNWFYYWSQALGGLSNITYGGSNPGVGGEVRGMTLWSYINVPDKTTRYIYDAAADTFSWVNPNFGPWTGIDCFHNVYLHESKHAWQIATYDADLPVATNTPWRYGWSWNQGLANHNHETLGVDGLPGVTNVDDDADGTVDNLIVTGRGELGFGGDDVRKCDAGWDTWPLSQGAMPTPPWAQNTPNEHKAWEAMTNAENTQAAKDWGNPGKRHATLNKHDD